MATPQVAEKIISQLARWPFQPSKLLVTAMNYFMFQTAGDWDSTTLYNNGEEFLADKLFVEAHCGRNDEGDPVKGGVVRGGEMTAYVLPHGQDQQFAIFPGKLEFDCPTHLLVVENSSPMFEFEATKVFLDREDVSERVLDVFINVDATANEVSAYITMLKPHFLSSTEIATYTLL